MRAYYIDSALFSEDTESAHIRFRIIKRVESDHIDYIIFDQKRTDDRFKRFCHFLKKKGVQIQYADALDEAIKNHGLDIDENMIHLLDLPTYHITSRSVYRIDTKNQKIERMYFDLFENYVLDDSEIAADHLKGMLKIKKHINKRVMS